MEQKQNQPIDLLTFPSAWNHLSFNQPLKLLKIALFVKKWPQRSHAGGLERHALTLHLALAKRRLDFPDYAHHVATSDHVGDILKRIYMIPEDRVHIILNGIDEETFRPDIAKGKEFKQKYGVLESRTLVLGMAGRLESVVVLVAGNGPWGARYRDLGSNIIVVGPLEQAQLAGFYNAIDIFMNPTLRAQGLDHTLLEAILCGKPVMATRLASITRSVIVGTEMGYTFSPTIASLKRILLNVLGDGREALKQKARRLGREKMNQEEASPFSIGEMEASTLFTNHQAKADCVCETLRIHIAMIARPGNGLTIAEHVGLVDRSMAADLEVLLLHLVAVLY
ncbi:hypothetical protein FNV43_RR13217 [Rhamnella rubrinervis]|uniref:Glycosyltransferase subfamily 4-like N-terminal domain-containing protein n=1 Tax=Rhamnella rubrinervis TaxID=2594499 RepID=A0A8K0H0U3_9ROSA|nr:hypothetical protein FNV43_RR13217 [Rhamnella rubrinervis]